MRWRSIPEQGTQPLTALAPDVQVPPRAHDPTVNHLAHNVGPRHRAHRQAHNAAVHQQHVPHRHVVNEAVVVDSDLPAAGALGDGEHHGVASRQGQRLGEVAGPDFRPLGVEHDGQRVAP